MGRTVVVGDVHGCAAELDELFDRIAVARDDRVVMVGDLVMRGPQPREVLALVRQVGGLSVRGNHEWRLLQWRQLRTTGRRRKRVSNSDDRILRSKSLARTAASFSDEDWHQLETMPLHIALPQHDLLVVHAGLVPGRPLESQDERALMYMRCLDANGEALEARNSGVLWGTRYVGPPHVTFGHNAQSEPQLHDWATGRDTGCVYGGKLTALVLEEDELVPRALAGRRNHLVTVDARETYVAIR